MLSFAQQNLKYPLQTREKLDFSLICRVVGTPLTIPQVDLCPTLASHGLKEEHVGQEPGPDHLGEVGFLMAILPYLTNFRLVALPHGLEEAPVVHKPGPGHLVDVGQPHHWSFPVH